MTVCIDGLPVMESKGLEHDTHVYVEDGPYTATLNRTDLNSVQAPNLSCTIQLLEADYFKRYYVVKSTGETGQAPKVTIKYFDENVGDAKILFKEEFYKKTGNVWDKRHNFQKRYGKYDLVQLADLSNTISELRMDSQSSLPASIQQLLILLLNINIINETIAEMDVDTSKMPLGVLADEQIASGYEALIELFIRVYKGKVNYNIIKDLSNKFYTKIPHKGSEKNLKVLDSLELIKSKLEMLVDLRSTRISYRLLQEEMDQSVNLMEGYYNRLKTQIVTLDKDSKEFNLIMEYFTNTQSETHLRSFTMFIEEIYRVEREGEMERYGPYRSLHNRKLLWHGSRLSNIAAILSEGLRIAPPEVQQTGCMFGKGIYFADVVSKSAQYIRATPDHPNGVLLLCEVALGNMKKCYTKEMITHLPEGVQSVWGVGRLQPDPARTRTLENGALVPLGNVVPNQDELSDQAKLIHNEYPFDIDKLVAMIDTKKHRFIVYNEAQVTIKYLLRLKFEL